MNRTFTPAKKCSTYQRYSNPFHKLKECYNTRKYCNREHRENFENILSECMSTFLTLQLIILNLKYLLNCMVLNKY